MPATSRLRLAIAATPALLADSLASLLPADVDVTLLTVRTAERFDVALLTPDTFPVDADIVIVLDDAPDSRGGGTVTVVEGSTPRHLDDLAEVLGALGVATGGPAGPVGAG